MNSCHVRTIVQCRDLDHHTERLEKAENVPHEVSRDILGVTHWEEIRKNETILCRANEAP